MYQTNCEDKITCTSQRKEKKRWAKFNTADTKRIISETLLFSDSEYKLKS